jgi:hypothetical protein
MMKRYIIGLLTVLALAAGVQAETVTQKQAKAVAQQFFNKAFGRTMPQPKYVYNGRRLTTQRLFVPFYVFTLPTQGYVIVSAENKAFPILGYSLREPFKVDKVGERMADWLRSYARDIELIRYDDRIPYEAIEAWGDIPAYIDKVLSHPYDATDPLITLQEAQENIDRVAYGGDATDDLWSDIYAPEQWQEMVDAQFAKDRNVAVGLWQNGEPKAFILHGRKGDYYRVELDEVGSQLMRLFATEYLSDGQLAALTGVPPIDRSVPEEAPFTFYDNFLAETERERKQRADAYDMVLTVTEPEVLTYGSGLYTVRMPEPVVLARVYNLSGALMRQYTYKDATDPHIDILDQPGGFYIVELVGRSGKTYGVKVAR